MFSIRLVAIITSSLFLLTVGYLMRFGEIFFIAGALLSLPAISYLFARSAIGSLSYSRRLPEYVHEGEPIAVEIQVTGKGKLLGTIEVDDTLPEWLHKAQSVDKSSSNSSAPATAVYSAIAEMRGEHKVGPLKVRASDPLGFFVFTAHHPLISRLVVLPRPLDVDGADSFAAKEQPGTSEGVFEGSGVKGSGLDFHGVREYSVGDDLRRVHWPSTARHGKLNVVEFEQTCLPDVAVAVDVQQGSSRGTGRYSTLEYAVRIAAGIAQRSINNGGRVSLTGAGVEGPAAETGRGTDHLYSILDALAGLQADHRESMSDILIARLDLLSPGSKLICIVSSIDEKLARCAEMMALRGIQVHMVLVTLEGAETADEVLSRSALPSSAGVTIVECSTSDVKATVRYEYAA